MPGLASSHILGVTQGGPSRPPRWVLESALGHRNWDSKRLQQSVGCSSV